MKKNNLRKILTGSVLIIPTLLILTNSGTKAESKVAVSSISNKLIKPLSSAVKVIAKNVTKLNTTVSNKIDGIFGKSKPSYTKLATKEHAFSTKNQNGTAKTTTLKADAQQESIYQSAPTQTSKQGLKLLSRKDSTKSNAEERVYESIPEPIYENVLTIR